MVRKSQVSVEMVVGRALGDVVIVLAFPMQNSRRRAAVAQSLQPASCILASWFANMEGLREGEERRDSFMTKGCGTVLLTWGYKVYPELGNLQRSMTICRIEEFHWQTAKKRLAGS